jgi:hypothetical protein
MKQIAFVAAALALLAIAAGAQTPAIAMPEKHSPTSGEPKYEGRIEGDTIEECWTIASLPFSGTGGTCAYLHDYDEAQPLRLLLRYEGLRVRGWMYSRHSRCLQ